MLSEEVVHLIAQYSNRQYCTVRTMLDFSHLPVSLDACVNCNGSCQMCENKTTLMRSHLSNRIALQVKEMEAIKYSDSSMQGYDIGWNAAAEVWIKEFADEFRLGHDKEHRAPKEVIDKFNQHLQRCYPPRCVAA